jgi:hypothetical protein
MSIPKTLREFVRQRAGNRCEYCLSHQEYVMGILQVEHWWPIARGGTDTAENLALACELCNQEKWAKTDATDPITGQVTLLFNPRQQCWNDHFRWSKDGSEVIGLTSCGRATILALQLNNNLAITVRRNWVKAGWHPPQIQE